MSMSKMSRLVAVCSSIGLAAAGVAYTAYKGGEPVHARVTCSNQYKFPAGSNYPDILQHRNYMAQVLTPEMYNKLRSRTTPHGCTFDECIQPGVDNPSNPHFKEVGCIAGDEESYEVFSEFFDKVIDERHEGYKPWDKHIKDMDYTKLKGGCLDDKFVLSSRVRTGRAIRGLRLPPSCTRAERREVERVIVEALNTLHGEFKGRYYPLKKMAAEEHQKLVEEGFMFGKPTAPQYVAAGMTRDWPDARGLWANDSKNFLVWINERDHARIISMQKGGNIAQTFMRYCKGVNLLEQEISKKGWDFMWNEHLGYMATSPADLGTGMRAGVHIKIPMLSKDPRFDLFLQAMHLQKRGTGGTDSPIVDDVYDISNSQRLGKSEVELMQVLIKGVEDIIKMEKELIKGGTIDRLLPASVRDLYNKKNKTA